jgi:hypothetical protein
VVRQDQGRRSTGPAAGHWFALVASSGHCRATLAPAVSAGACGGRSHSHAWVGCIVCSTIANSSTVSVSRSISSRRRAFERLDRLGGVVTAPVKSSVHRDGGSQDHPDGRVGSLLTGLKGGGHGCCQGDTVGTATESPTGSDGREALRTLSDKPLEDDADDQLGFAAYADALAELLDHPATDTPLTIAISAQWGAGKTSLAKMVEGRLQRRPIQRSDPPHITCWFNAWMHDDAPHLGAAFAAEVAKTADRYRPRWRRLIFPLPSAMLSPEERWHRRLRVALLSFVVAVVIAMLPSSGRALRQAFAPKADVVDRLQELLGSTRVGAAIFLLVAFAFWRKVFAIAQAAARFVDDPKSEAAKGSMQDVKRQLRQLIEQATHVRRQWFVFPRPARRFVIFVDDLERCQPPRAVEVCEVASQLLGHPNVVTVLIADMATIAASAESKYADLERVSSDEGSDWRSRAGSYGRLYLQKIVQIQFNLPPSPVKDMPRLLRESVRRSSSKPVKSMAGLLRESVRRALSRNFWIPRTGRSLRVTEARTVRRITATVVLVVGIFGGLAPLIRDFSRWWPVILIAIGVVNLFDTIWEAFAEDYRTLRTREMQRRLDNDIRRTLAAGAETVEEVMEALAADDLEPKWVELAKQRAQRMLADESVLRTQAESEIKKYLPPLPRSAKRLFNHLRVLLVVAEQRHMFGGQPELQAKHLGKWAVLLERWPELGSALTAQPGKLAELEAATSIEELSTRLHPALASSLTSQDLLAFLKSPTKLAPIAERLVYFQPASSDQVVEAGSDRYPKIDASISPASKS